MGSLVPLHEGLVAIVTDTDTRRIDYYGVGRRDFGEVKIGLLSIGKSNLSAFVTNGSKGVSREITSDEHFNYLVADARRELFDVVRSADTSLSYEEQLVFSAQYYVHRSAQENSLHDLSEVRRRTNQVSVPYQDVSTYRVLEAERFFGSLEVLYKAGSLPSARLTQQAHNFLVQKSAPVPVVLDELSKCFDVDFFDLREEMYAVRDAYIRHPEDFTSSSAQLRDEMHARLLKKKYDVVSEPWNDVLWTDKQ